VKLFYFFVVSIFLGVAMRAESGPKPLLNAHSHNDYAQRRPLKEALENGFGSVEADVHLSGEELLVGHNAEDLTPERNLERMYLAPLKARVKKNGGRVYPNGPSVTLLIDIKTEAQPTYLKLKELLEKYRPMLTVFKGEMVETNAVTVILSGNRPRALLLDEKERLAAYDGRLSDLGQHLPVSFMPLVSDNWAQQFEWQGSGPFSEADRAKLERLVSAAHREHRRIRFWGVPDNEMAWRITADAGVDLLNTDHIGQLAEFLRERAQR
jgi:glycerophosphoryl diester phosphodiesterase